MIKEIEFNNFKLFNSEQTFEIKPMTVLIGKNSSGKSAIAKLPTLIAASLKGEITEPFSWDNNGVILGASVADLNYGKDSTGLFRFKLKSDNGTFFTIEIQYGKNDLFVKYWNYNDEFIVIYDLESKLYTLNSGEKVKCTFKGFKLDSISDPIDIPNLEIFNFDLDYICSYRIKPIDLNEDQPKEKHINQIGIDGRYAYEILKNDYISSRSELLDSVSKWYENTFEGWGINLDVDTSRNKYYFELKRDIPFPFTTKLDNVGQGISQTLPLVTKSFLKEMENSLTIIEEPELHLHPSAHGDLAERFAESLTDGNKRYIIETHSENFILRLRRLIAEKKFSYFTEKDIKIYYVQYDKDKNCSSLQEVKVSANGDVENWPRKVFSESLDELIAIKNAQK